VVLLSGVRVTQSGSSLEKNASEKNASDKNGSSAWLPETEAERAAIREQLDRILTSPLFKNSKRYPNLLRFVVDRSLEGHTEPLKERTLGIEVFGREPDYDTNLDPVVRTTAVEIRKRIAQYYHEPGHETEIRIDFPPGTYVPEFRMPPKPAVSAPVLEPPAAPPSRKVRYLGMGAAAIVLLGAIVAARSWDRATPLDLFWEPVLKTVGPVTIYMGRDVAQTQGPVVSLKDLRESEMVAFADSTAMARITALLVARHENYRFRLQPSAKMEDMRDGPSILIGAFNNSWALKLTGESRFSFSRDPQTHSISIRDRDHPELKKWSHDLSQPYTELTEDYAIVSRMLDPTTGKIVVISSGLFKFGTEAAGEFLTCESCMNELAAVGPADWSRKNMQIVIGASVVGRTAGPPRILAKYFW
jgi:hypothetical protein